MPKDSVGALYGNLQSYKLYVRPAAHALYGNSFYRKKPLSKHQQNVQQLLEILAFNGTLTTWGIAKVRLAGDIPMIRKREKEFRRLLLGRLDKQKKSKGLLDVGLVVKDETTNEDLPRTKYRLSLHGILYCLDVFDLSNREMDIIAAKYSNALPRVFGKWAYLKSIIGDYVYGLRILAKGLLLDIPQIAKSDVPMYELMAFSNVKYRKNFESISEEDLAEQMSYWFYTNLLYSLDFKLNKKKQSVGTQRLKSVLDGDKEIKKWYFDFYQQVTKFYKTRVQTLDKLNIF